MTGFAQQIKQARVKSGYSQTSLAKTAGISLTYLRLIEDGERIPAEDFVLRLAEALSLDKLPLLLSALSEKAPDAQSRRIYETMASFTADRHKGFSPPRNEQFESDLQQAMDDFVISRDRPLDRDVLSGMFEPGFARGWNLAVNREALDGSSGFFDYLTPEHIGEGFEFIPKAAPHVDAGGGFLVEDESTEGWFCFRRDWLSTHGGSNDKVLLEVEGESMLPTLHNHDVILVDKSETGRVLRPGKVFVVRDGDGIVVKRLHRGEAANGLRLGSDNPDKNRFPDREIIVPEGEPSPILGRVIWAGCEIS